MRDNTAHIRLTDGQAAVQMGGRTIRVSRWDIPGEPYHCPVELVAAALGSWMVLTMAAVADNKKIKLDEVDVQIGYEIHAGKSWSTRFAIRVDLGNKLTPRERTILFNSARGCEVSKMLSGENKFHYELANGASEKRTE